MPVCLTHNQSYGTAEWCPYCGNPNETRVSVGTGTTQRDYLEAQIGAAMEVLNGQPMEAIRMLRCPDCTTAYPADAIHRCNMRAVELPEIKDEDIPPHERI